ncbi:hypothetical protein SteCoe_4062 [Stentor coeruleus]|uniref:F-box domain-containing protein n=1 Tax=Stentor coeruleus TaxID=5963 RepID=A0A1R2CVH9_9CILI|nr:hypothetical protein SteCoe_4062 [Stentor coeruleus]
MDLPAKRKASSFSFSPPASKLRKVDIKISKSPIISKNLWIKILSYLDLKTYYQIVPGINKFFRSLVNKGASNANFVTFVIEFKAENKQNKQKFINKKEFAKFISKKNLLKRLRLIFKNLNAYGPSDHTYFLNIHPFIQFEKVKYAHLKIDSLKHLYLNKFFSFFPLIKSLRFDLQSDSNDLLLIFDLFFAKDFILSNYFKNISKENVYIPNNLKSLIICANLEKSKDIDLFETISSTKNSQLREIVIKDYKRNCNLNFKALRSFCCSDKLIKLKLPVFCLTNAEAVYNFCLYIGNNTILRSLTICTILLEYIDILTTEFTRNRSLTKLHFIGVEAAIENSLILFNSISTMNVNNFSLASRAFQTNKLCKEYIIAIDKLLSSSKIIKLNINLVNCSFKKIQSLAEIIINHAHNHKLEWFIKHNLKFCLQNRLEIPSVSGSYNYSTYLAFEVFSQIVNRIQNMSGLPVSAEDFTLKLKELIKTSKLSIENTKFSVQVFYYSILSIKYPDLECLNLISIEINSDNICFLKVLNVLKNLKTLKLCVSNIFNLKELLNCLTFCNSKLENLNLDFTSDWVWRESYTKIIKKLNHLSKLHLLGINAINSDLYISSTIQNLQIFKISYSQFNQETFPYLISGFKACQNLLNIKLNKICIHNYDECIAMQELLDILKEKNNLTKIYIRFNNLNPSLIIQTRDIYMNFMQTIDLIVLNNKNLTELSVLIPVYYKFLTEYSFHIYELVKKYTNIEIINTFKIKSCYEDNFSYFPEELLPSEKSKCSTLPDTSRFLSIMPIIISQLFVKYDTNFVVENYFSQDLDTIKLDFNPPYANPLLNILVFSMIRIFENLQVFILGNILLDPTIACVLSWNIALIPNLRKIVLKNLETSFEEILWVFSAQKLKSLKFYDMILLKKNDEVNFKLLLQSANIEKLCLWNVIYNVPRKHTLFTINYYECQTCHFDIENQSMIFDFFSGCKAIKLKYASKCVDCANIVYDKIKEFPMLKVFVQKIIPDN